MTRRRLFREIPWHLYCRSKTNKDESIHNVSLSVENEDNVVAILNDSNVWYYETIKKNEVVTISMKIQIPMGMESDSFHLQYTSAYENEKGSILAENGTIAVKIYKKPQITV